MGAILHYQEEAKICALLGFSYFDPKKEALIILKNDLRKFQIDKTYKRRKYRFHLYPTDFCHFDPKRTLELLKSQYFEEARLWATSPSLFLSLDLWKRKIFLVDGIYPVDKFLTWNT